MKTRMSKTRRQSFVANKKHLRTVAEAEVQEQRKVDRVRRALESGMEREEVGRLILGLWPSMAPRVAAKKTGKGARRWRLKVKAVVGAKPVVGKKAVGVA